MGIKMQAQRNREVAARYGLTGRIACWSAAHQWWVACAAALLLFAAVTVSALVPTELLHSDGGEGEAAAGWRLVEKHFDHGSESPELLVISHPSLRVDDPAYRSFVEATVGSLQELPETGRIITFYETGDTTLVSADGKVMMVPVFLTGHIAHVLPLVDRAGVANSEGFSVSMAGWETLQWQSAQVQSQDFARVLMITLVLGLVILTIAFRAVVAAVIPILMAMGAIVATMAIAALVSQAYPLNELYAEMVLLMGLAVGIDYSLFVVSRYRRERAEGRSKLDAISVASDTTGRAVLYAGITVILSLAGLVLTQNEIFISLALGAVIVVALAVLGSLTLLPALLSILGDTINRLRLPAFGAGDGGSIWGWITDRVLERPVLFSSLVLAALLMLAAPVAGLNLGFSSGASAFPDAVRGKEALKLLEEHFSVGVTQPAVVVIEARNVMREPVHSAIHRVADLASEDPRFIGPAHMMASADNRVAMVRLTIDADPDDPRAIEAIRYLRSQLVPGVFDGVPANVYVAGPIAGGIDFTDYMYQAAPYVFTFVLGLAFVLLLVMFRSVVIPVKAIALNLLSVGAAYGVLVLVFQHGVGQDLLGFEATGRVAPWLPLFLFTILFGLSMDYHMLLLGRIKEAHHAGFSNDDSVSIGIRSTAGTITSAAAIMVGVFASFALASTLELKQFGVGLGASVLIDATIIRVILLPASMKLLGDWNWYLPSWLEWLPGLEAEGATQPGSSVAERVMPVLASD